MKVTLNIDNTLLQRLREEAARHGTTMSALVEAGIRRILNEDTNADPVSESIPPLPKWHGGQMLVDVSNRDELYRVIEDA